LGDKLQDTALNVKKSKMLFCKIEAGPRIDFTICGYTNYLTDSDRKKELDAMLI